MTLKQFFISVLVALCIPAVSYAAQKPLKLTSPNGKIAVEVSANQKVSYSVSFNGRKVLVDDQIAMKLTDGTSFGLDKKPLRVKSGKVNSAAVPAIVYKKNTVNDVYNYLTLGYKNYSIEFRAYNTGVAYRFVSTAKSGLFNVESEKAEFNFAEDWNVWASYVRDGKTFEEQFKNSFENYYSNFKLSNWDSERLAFLPIVVDGGDGLKICITESDLLKYPGMYLNGQGKNNLSSVYAPYPSEWKQAGHNNLQYLVTAREKYIAKAKAGQTFPWRIVGIVPESKDLTNLDLVWNLATPAKAEDWSWVKPGKVAWDWWNNWNLYGVDFKAGVNNETYKYYIDFASEKGIEYVILDEGWATKGKADLLDVIPQINLVELAAYAKSKNVGLILWAGYAAIEKDIDGIFRHYAEMGIKGFKIDFMDRDDQIVVEFYERAAALAAKHHLLVDFHGAFKPSGLTRTYPNVLNFEGVNGLEQMKWTKDSDHVAYDCTIPFVRMIAGPMDYTQGAMRNATKANFSPNNSEPMSQGTRCHQLAEYAIFEAPLTMLCDSPSNYLNEPECTEFIANFPTTWDETVPLCGEIGQYVAIARRKGNAWYVGAITNWSSRDLTLDLSFIGGGNMTIFQDGINANRAARDYKKVSEELPSDGRVKIHMANGGGWAAVIKK